MVTALTIECKNNCPHYQWMMSWEEREGPKLAKMEIKQAYRNIPSMHWNGEVFVDALLAFGLRSAPLLFTAVMDAFQWIMQD